MNIMEFAQLAGVSTATVSRAFHEPDKIRPETRSRILALAESVHYYPNPSGRALSKGRHDVLGLVWPLEVEGAETPFIQRVLAALSRQLISHDLDLLICPVDRSQPNSLEHAHRTLRRSRCDGWLLLYPRHDDPLIEALRTSGKPVTCLMGQVPACPAWKSVRLNQHVWIEDALRRLHARDARRVLFFGGRPGEPDNEDRRHAFLELVPRFCPHHDTLPAWPATAEVVKPRLRGADAVDAIIGVDAAAAHAAVHACRELNLRVPADVAVLSIDVYPDQAGRELSPARFAQPLDAMMAYAIELTLGLKNRSRTFAPVPVDEPPSFTI
ncbi:LacI family DNA-binding transcriptional regulator [Synoicihabitans lomoniglobus]|uniref:LacI family DNA-binding transcriptional regulator n=1 Tax=Synoicihabitans lomoniglobus TaxID=2909285 RepID=A0AAF0I1W0_9BACT|nr:LacI family transcriptional regulator [Opitutaceae bacterium LMO-M01]WED66072.1 LacI family DNA-binding transcriptional regulator [Opitutaceae bacterium LMO-M01]